MVTCQKCAADNPDDAKFCRRCGNSLLEKTQPEEQKTPNEQQSQRQETPKDTPNFREICGLMKDGIAAVVNEEPREKNDTICPFCQESDCQPLQKSATEVHNQGYRWGSGCCGMFLLGPFGLLCGMCGTGSKVKITNELWWTCKKCGKQHISKDSASTKWDAAVTGLVGTGFAGGVLLMLARWLELGFVTILIGVDALITPISGLYQVYKTLSQELGTSIIGILTPKQKKDSLLLLGVSLILVLAVGIFGLSLLEYFLGA